MLVTIFNRRRIKTEEKAKAVAAAWGTATSSVVEPFHFDPVPASQDGSPSSSSSSVLGQSSTIFLCKKSSEKFTGNFLI